MAPPPSSSQANAYTARPQFRPKDRFMGSLPPKSLLALLSSRRPSMADSPNLSGKPASRLYAFSDRFAGDSSKKSGMALCQFSANYGSFGSRNAWTVFLPLYKRPFQVCFGGGVTQIYAGKSSLSALASVDFSDFSALIEGITGIGRRPQSARGFFRTLQPEAEGPRSIDMLRRFAVLFDPAGRSGGCPRRMRRGREPGRKMPRSHDRMRARRPMICRA